MNESFFYNQKKQNRSFEEISLQPFPNFSGFLLLFVSRQKVNKKNFILLNLSTVVPLRDALLRRAPLCDTYRNTLITK